MPKFNHPILIELNRLNTIILQKSVWLLENAVAESSEINHCYENQNQRIRDVLWQWRKYWDTKPGADIWGSLIDETRGKETDQVDSQRSSEINSKGEIKNLNKFWEVIEKSAGQIDYEPFWTKTHTP